MARSEPGGASKPSDIDWGSADKDAIVPGTVASTLMQADNAPPRISLDDFDWWYQCQFQLQADDLVNAFLQFDGLSTIAEIWLNNEQILTSRNMFRSFRVDVSSQLQTSNDLCIVFRSLNHDLKTRRPRPRWKTNLIGNQQLRWIRTSMLGRIPGWTPPIAPVGPWRDVQLVHGGPCVVDHARLHPTASDNATSIHIDVALSRVDLSVQTPSMTLSIAGKDYALDVDIDSDSGSARVRTTVDVTGTEHWHPLHNGEQRLFDYSLNMTSGAQVHTVRNGKLGFRSVCVDRSDDRVAFMINDQPMFARGGCWTSNDIVSLVGDPDDLREKLTLLRSAGCNMIRVGGTMIYESDLFYDLCDELGICVWQDFMFANMDYPVDDGAFLDDALAEIRAQVLRLREHPCIVAFCGNSEVEQQAAMFGTPAETWKNRLFYEHIPALLAEYAPNLPYFESSPCEGALPFHNAVGPSHYFGVGAYKQGLDDLQKSDVKFATECLAFSNFPSDAALRRHFGTVTPATHHPQWKAGVPRDSSAGWDFEDIRDHYIAKLFGIDPVQLRYADKERYAALSQVVTGEVMSTTFNYWRSRYSKCAGGLIWFLNDIVPGAGWGLIDSDGQPKPAYYYMARSWADRTVSIRDCGMDGLSVIVANDSNTEMSATLDIQVLQNSRICIAQSNEEVRIAANRSDEFSIDQSLGRFFDSTYRYRFGPAKHDVVIASLVTSDQQQDKVACYFPGGHSLRSLERADVTIEHQAGERTGTMTIESDSFLQSVKLTSRTHDFGDNYFHLAPGIKKLVTSTQKPDSSKPLRGVLSALNLPNPIAFS